MLLFPKNTPPKKVHSRKTIISTLVKSTPLNLGDFSITAIEGGYITSKQLVRHEKKHTNRLTFILAII